MAVSKTITFETVGGREMLKTSVDFEAHQFIISRIYGGNGRGLNLGEDNDLITDVFEAFGFTIVFEA